MGTTTEPLHVKTPYLHSSLLSDRCGHEVFLKLDALQASGSFKDRGMLRLCQQFKSEGIKRVVSSSGGNAGLAVACSGRKLGMEVHVVVPETTKRIMVDKIRAQGATVQIHGANWNAADEVARKLTEDEGVAYCHPFDHPTVWTGNASIVDEMKEQGPKPDVIICSVGGGGLLLGVLEGLERNGWDDVDVIAVEAEGAHSLHETVKADELVSLPGITSICTSMGALRVSDQCLPRIKKHKGTVHSVVVEDKQCVSALLNFSFDHRLLVEPSCSATLSLIYDPENRKHIEKYNRVAVVVCGGSACTLDLIDQWKKDFGL